MHGGGNGIYIHMSVKFIIKSKSCDQDNCHNCDYIIIELYEPKLLLCTLYSPLKSKHDDIITLIEKIQNTNYKIPCIIGGDYM